MVTPADTRRLLDHMTISYGGMTFVAVVEIVFFTDNPLSFGWLLVTAFAAWRYVHTIRVSIDVERDLVLAEQMFALADSVEEWVASLRTERP